MLAADDLCCERGGRALFSNLEFALDRGVLMHIRGANGSGKTSLLRMLCGLTPPAAGRITWEGEDIRELRENYTAQILHVGHHPAIKDELTALENLQIAQALAGQPVSSVEAKAALNTVGLQGRANLPARVLSQGQRRRVALARLWLSRSPLWILDEPFNALDVDATAMLERHIETHLGCGGMVVLTTHQKPAIASERLQVVQLS